MTFTVSQKQGPHGLLLVITDTDLLGKKIEEGNVQFNLSAQFYEGEEMSKEEVVELLHNAKDIHATGKHSVGLLVERDIVQSSSILYVQGVPHAQAVRDH